MSNIKFYGDVEEEVTLKDSIEARNIVQEILKFGINQFQVTKIIYLLSLELEDQIVIQGINNLIKPLLEGKKEENKSSIIT